MNTASVLFVDDVAENRELLVRRLKRLGLSSIEQAANGRLALEAIARGRFDLVLLDIMMPEMDGNEVCKAIRSMDGGDIVPIIMLTARDSLKDKVDALQWGADDYLTKPFHYEELQARVRAQMRVRTLHQELRRKNAELEEMQAKLVEKERQIAVGQLAGTAAHELGQPLSAMLLNCHLLENVSSDDPRHAKALGALRADIHRMSDLIEKLRSADAAKVAPYHGATNILDLKKEE